LDECVSALQERQKSRELDPLIDPGTAVLYTISFPDRLVLLLNFSGGEMTQAEVAIGESELTETLAEFRKHLGSQGNPRRLLGTAMQLYEWLMRPIRPALDARRIRTLVVAPDQALRLLPFAALHDGRDFLVNRYAFVTSPGLTLTELEAGAPNRSRALLAGLSSGVQGFGQLPHVGDEVDAMAQLFDGESLVDEAFLKNSVRRELERAPYGIVSFSTHAQISGDPRQSFLLTYDDRIDLNELERFVRTSQLRDQPLDLLVLSACETAEGDERAALGLAGVAVKAGARSVMASLWAVSDASTAELVPQFLKYLKEPGVTKAQALQRAQQRLLASTDYRQPYYWAPFVLIGNWH
jgi:CHAT domain-containing protein